jgi:hypothetical protein
MGEDIWGMTKKGAVSFGRMANSASCHSGLAACIAGIIPPHSASALLLSASTCPTTGCCEEVHVAVLS